jgi:hypothetical protein
MIRKTILGTLTAVFALTASFAFAETAKNSSTTKSMKKAEVHLENKTTSSSTRPLLRDRANASSTKMVDSACAKTAVDIRKASLISIYGKFTNTLNSALATREEAVKSSFDQTTKKARQEARTTARSTYKKSVKSAYDTMKSSEKTTMKTYASSIKACGGTSAEASDESSDGSIADSIN